MAMEATVWIPPELRAINGSSYQGAVNNALGQQMNNGTVTHFVADVLREGEEHFIEHLMNSNPLLHTAEWRMVQVTNELRGVDSSRLRRLTLWNCAFRVSVIDALVRTAENLVEFVLGGQHSTVIREEAEVSVMIILPHLKQLHVNLVDVRYEGEYQRYSMVGRHVGQ
ncbi:uncharacterized protein ARMOST_20958 [Armillaria ostoyae]|uniref:Uncharacterized protein n=1 Tax=Armillaria ostoyae TaxID=47428 RepID=A0A284S8T7_ARMOS|nr:uncharacterized protein ARMOST_20958 [Armillaria ostoyae]